MSAVPEFAWMSPDPKTELETIFENAPLAMARFHRQGVITSLNAGLECLLEGKSKAGRAFSGQSFSGQSCLGQSLRLADLFHPEDREECERLVRELFEGERESFQLDSLSNLPNVRKLRWTAWRVSGAKGEWDYALAIAQDHEDSGSEYTGRAEGKAEAERRLRQAQKLESVGRLAGGIAHDFNNLLTGVLLYCDLLIASLEPAGPGLPDIEPAVLEPNQVAPNQFASDQPALNELEQKQIEPNQLSPEELSPEQLAPRRVRKYAEEIRKAGLQAANVVQQLLAVARPANCEPSAISLNQIIEGMRNLLLRLIGENIELRFQLDPHMGLVKMDPTQAQQILLNLVLNARDAMPGGGRIAIETSSCKVQVLSGSRLGANESTLLPCALFVVSDNGNGMDVATRAHLFEAFFTTKSAGKGTGLGLATVHDIVTRNGGLIHVDSALACGTRVSILLPLIPEAPLNSQLELDLQSESLEGALPAIEKESML
jgi:signal transduction histidine kinase